MKYDISALGNALVDTQYMVDHDFLDEIGLEADSMTLASAEEHSPIIDKLQSMGVESVSYYGSKCHHVCRVANDEDGKKYLESLQKAGVQHIGYSKEDSEMPTGKCLIFVTPDAKRTMSSMLGISAYLGSKDINYDAINNSKIFYIEGYMVTSDENFSAVTSVLNHVKNENTKNYFQTLKKNILRLLTKPRKKLPKKNLGAKINRLQNQKKLVRFLAVV